MNNLKLETTNLKKWLANIQLFLAPMAIIYLVAVIGAFNASNGAFSVSLFIPTPFTLGAGSLYMLNTALDYFKKLKRQKKK